MLSRLLLPLALALGLSAAERPNIIVIMADDLGYSDLGCYGGEIRTPNLDRLAKNGLRFSQFYNASRCCPTRASLMTGVYPHQTGVGRMTQDTGLPGYRGELSRSTPTIAEELRRAGYSTAMVGKWHLSLTKDSPENALWVSHRLDLGPFSNPATYPVSRGFDEHWGTIWGVVDYFDPFSLVHDKDPQPAPPDGFYYTDALNDRAAAMIEEYGARDEPFFLYLAHTAPHWPLQALPEDIAHYERAYTDGWDALRAKRYARMQQLGLLDPETAALSERQNPGLRWEDNPHQDWDARAMAVHAAMVDRLDQGLSRVFAALERTGEWDDTLIVFLSDNGASPEEPEHYLPGFDRPSHTRDGRRIRYSTRKRKMPGPQDSYAGIGPMWSNAVNTPFRFWKKEQYEGGVATPFIAHWPAGLEVEPGSITPLPGHVIDIMATALDLAGAKPSHPIEGKSLRPILEGRAWDEPRTFYFEHFGSRAVREGDWKLVLLANREWELFDLSQDRTETRDLSAAHPDTVRRLEKLWQEWARSSQVLPAPGPR